MQNPSRRALVLSHLPFEDLGSLATPLREREFALTTADVATASFPLPLAQSCDLLIVLGGPIGVYDQEDYPFLKGELACIRQRLDVHQPILGICLGAQLMAAALGARVYPGQHGAEIGWSAIQPASKENLPEWFSPLVAPGVSVFHWHGDTFDLPSGASHLAKSKVYDNQAFAVGDFALGLQFHPEVTAAGLERWYVGHACELHHARIAPGVLRSDAAKHAAALEDATRQFWNAWLDCIL